MKLLEELEGFAGVSMTIYSRTGAVFSSDTKDQKNFDISRHGDGKTPCHREVN